MDRKEPENRLAVVLSELASFPFLFLFLSSFFLFSRFLKQTTQSLLLTRYRHFFFFFFFSRLSCSFIYLSMFLFFSRRQYREAENSTCSLYLYVYIPYIDIYQPRISSVPLYTSFALNPFAISVTNSACPRFYFIFIPVGMSPYIDLSRDFKKLPSIFSTTTYYGIS